MVPENTTQLGTAINFKGRGEPEIIRIARGKMQFYMHPYEGSKLVTAKGRCNMDHVP